MSARWRPPAPWPRTRDHLGPEGSLIAFGVEGTGSYGIGLARFLRRAGLNGSGQGPHQRDDRVQGHLGHRDRNLRGELEPLTDYQLITACAALDPATTTLDHPDATSRTPSTPTPSTGSAARVAVATSLVTTEAVAALAGA